ncbi:MAG: AbrB/MazE/SpoVT family DNA-binding domain-containing protein [Solirubrobacteraceae bacterium]
MRVTAKGQITIPQELRERFDLRPGAEIEVVAAEDGALVRPAGVAANGRRLVEQLRDRADAGLTADEVLLLTRGESG